MRRGCAPHSGRKLARAASRAGEIACICAWALAFLVGAQGWVPAGSQWYAASGASLWSPCGSAMCACPVEDKSPVQRHAQNEASCCPEGESAAGAEGSPGFCLVALGSTRRDDSHARSMPESLVLQLPPLGIGNIDTVYLIGSAALPAKAAHAGRALDVPPAPPRA